MLNQFLIHKYKDDGIIKSPESLPNSLVKEMLKSLDRLLGDNPELPAESLICPHIPLGKSHNKDSAAEWYRYATNPQILDIVESLIGPNIILWGSQIFCKPPKVGKPVPWHQDGHYWPIKPLETCSVWIALDPANVSNGCMRYIPGSHIQKNLLPHYHVTKEDNVLGEQTKFEQKDYTNPRDNILKRGEFSLHDAFLIHGSNANMSQKRRAGFVIRYMPATSVFCRSSPLKRQSGVVFDFNSRPIWLVRGRDSEGKNDFEIGHDINQSLSLD